jgi:general secretion pathway protein J
MSKREEGFTLIELLVSLAILGLVTGMLFSGIAAARTLSERSARSGENGIEAAASQRILRELIEHVVPVIRRDGSAPYVDMRGMADTLSFYAPDIAEREPAGIRRYRLLLTAPGDLVLYSVSDLADRVEIDGTNIAGWRAVRLMAGVESLSIDYYGVAPPDNSRRWRARWEDRPQPPELVRVRLRYGAGDVRIWPDLVVRPATNVNTACAIDALTGRCREKA